MREFISASPDETMRFAGEFAKKLMPGSVVALEGELGAGKTVFVKGIARQLKIQDEITRPTFNIVKEYEGTLKLYHFDVYRIADPDELYEIGFEDYLNSNGILIIEWASNVLEVLPEDIIEVKITGSGYLPRKITVTGEKF